MSGLYPHLNVTRTNLGEAWPFTIDGGILQLRDGKFVVLVTNRGVYALHGPAKEARLFMRKEPRFRPIREIWDFKISIMPLIQMGLALGAD